MLARGNHIGRAVWLGLAPILAIAYAYQLVPHAHAAHEPDHAHDVPAPHANHSHSHDDFEADQQDAPHHHHAPTIHLDSHLLRAQHRGSMSDQDPSHDVVRVGLGTIESPTRDRAPDHPHLLPDAVPIVIRNPRGPPILG